MRITMDKSPKVRPILFRDEMVYALLAGTKTQTRRVVKGQTATWERVSVEEDIHGGEFFVVTGPKQPDSLRPIVASIFCSYGQPGDLLWVRETWCRYGNGYIYRANYAGGLTPISDGIGGPWKPSIHMPRMASRLTLRVTQVRVERVQDISETDARAEGVAFGTAPPHDAPTAKWAFGELWDSMRAGTEYAWERNPWVWVVCFDVIRENVDRLLSPPQGPRREE